MNKGSQTAPPSQLAHDILNDQRAVIKLILDTALRSASSQNV